MLDELKALGTKYLANHPVNKWYLFHSNQTVARQIAQFSNPLATPADIRNFLIEKYLELPNGHGELAFAIADYINKHIMVYDNHNHDNALPKSLLIRSLSPAILKKIGTEYLRLHPKKTLFHSNQKLAQCLVDCRFPSAEAALVNPSPKELWELVFSVYAWLPKSEGHLAEALETLLMKCFTLYSIPKVISHGGGAYRLTSGQVAQEVKNIIYHELYAADHSRELPSLPKRSLR